MSERGVGKPWTTYEDNLLIQAVAIHGENDNWKAVAASVPGRTNKACRKRWLHSLSPNVKKSAWTAEEDQLLLSLFATHGTKWSVIARNIPGRTDDACSKRYREALDPSLKRDDWTADEDAKLLEAYSRLGGKWGFIGQELNRSGLGCRNRWRMLERRRAARPREVVPRGEPSSSAPGPSGTSQWTPTHVQEPPFWDGRSPQYVAPSELYQGSPPHAQETLGTSYSPEQILSGAHLNGPSSASRESNPHFSSSTLGAALSQPGSVAHSPQHHAYYHSANFSPNHGLPESSGLHVSSHDYEFMPIDNHDDLTASTFSSAAHLPSADLFAGDTDPGIASALIPSDSPASPSQCGSTPPSPRSAPVQCSGDQPDTPAVEAGTSSDPVSAPRSYYLTDEEKARRAAATRRPAQPRPVRLSLLLPATQDADVLPYACGHSDCWPAGASCSKNAFTTSKELSDHSKKDHQGGLGGGKPFRCGLKGCEKSWKSLNGLQYHLQISRYHFQQALATQTEVGEAEIPAAATAAESELRTTTVSTSGADDHSPAEVAEADADAEAHTETAQICDEPPEKTGPEKPKRKLHPCPHPGCGKQYKQLGGLRYHLTHGHLDVPTQLDVVPPTLARMVAEKSSTERK